MKREIMTLALTAAMAASIGDDCVRRTMEYRTPQAGGGRGGTTAPTTRHPSGNGWMEIKDGIYRCYAFDFKPDICTRIQQLPRTAATVNKEERPGPSAIPYS
ncbi:MAG: hypothetical protein ACLUAR_11385 [Pilosibacter sp.]